MENREKAFWQMQKDCINFCKKNKIVWKDYPVIDTLINLLESNETQLVRAFQAVEVNDPSGHASQKDLQLNKFTNKIYRLCRKLSLYAKMTGNQLLLNDVDLTESSLYSLSEDQLLRIFTTILNHANRHVHHLKDYMVTLQDLDSLRLELTNLKHLSINRKHLTNKRINTTRSISELIIEARMLLDRLDDAFEGLITQENFTENWFELRKIKGVPIFRKSSRNFEKSKDIYDLHYYG